MASKNIKGITIEIDGNTQPLQNALNDLNKQTKSVNKELNQVNQALKLDPGNAEQVARKLELLEQQADLAQKKVEALKAAQKEMDAQGVDKASKEYQSLTTQIAKAEGEYNKIIATAKNTKEEFDKVSESTKLLNTYLAATGQTADDLKNIEGISKLVNDFEAGSLGAQGFNKILNALSQELTGTTRNADLLKNALSSGNFTEVSQALNKLTTDASGYRTELNDLQNAQTRLNTYFTATETTVKDFGNVLGSELTAKIESGKASSQELATALDKIGASAIQNSGDLDKFKATLDSVDSGVSFGNIKSELDSLGQEANETGEDISGLGDQLNSINDSVDLGNLMEASDSLGGLSEGIIGFAENSMEASSQVQDSLAQIKTQLGLTDEEAQRISQAAQDVYFAGYGESIDDCTEAAILLQQNIEGITPDNLVDMTTQATTLAKVLGVDNNEAIRGLRGAMAGFGVDAQTAMDIFAVAQQKGLNLSQEMLDNIAEYAPRWKDSGVSMQEYFSLFEAGMASGAYSSDKVLDFLNEFKTSLDDGRIEAAIGNFSTGTQELFQRYKDGEPVAKECLQAITGELGNMENQSQAATLASEMWSSLGEDNAMAMITAMNGATDAFGNCAGASKKLAEDNSNSVETMKRKWEELALKFAPVGEKLAEVGLQIADKVIPVIEKLVDWFSKLSPESQGLIGIIAGIIAILPTLIGLISGIVAICNPIGAAVTAIVVGIGALGAIIAAVASHWGEITQQWSEFCGDVAEDFSHLWSNITTALGQAGEGLKNAFGSIGSNISGVWNSMCSGLSTTWDNLKNGVTQTAGSIRDNLSTTWEAIKTNTGESWNTFCTTISVAWSNLWTGIQEIWNTVVEWFSTIFTGLSETIGVLWTNFCTFISEAWNNLWSSIQSGWEATTEWFGSIFSTISEVCGEGWSNFTTFLTDTWNNCWNAIQNVFSSVSTALSGAFDNARNNLTNIWNTLCTAVINAWNSFSSNLSNITQNIFNFLQNIWNNILTTISNIVNNISNTISNVWNGISNNINNILNNIYNIISNAWNNAVNAVANALNNISSTVSNIWNGIVSTVSNCISNIQNTISNGFNGVVNLVTNALSAIPDAISNIFGRALSIVQDFVSSIWDALSGIGNAVSGAVSNVAGAMGISYNLENATPLMEVPTHWMAKGGILTKPILFGAGEAGAEAVIPLNKLNDYINTDETNKKLDELISVMSSFCSEALNKEFNVNIDGKRVASAIVPQMDNQLGIRTKRMARQ